MTGLLLLLGLQQQTNMPRMVTRIRMTPARDPDTVQNSSGVSQAGSSSAAPAIISSTSSFQHTLFRIVKYFYRFLAQRIYHLWWFLVQRLSLRLMIVMRLALMLALTFDTYG